MNNNLMAKSNLETKDLLLLDSEVKNRGKSMVVAYILWYFLGVFGAHRFYLGRKGSAIAQLILFISIIGTLVTCVWWVVDAFLTHQYVKEQNNEIESIVLAEINARNQQATV